MQLAQYQKLLVRRKNRACATSSLRTIETKALIGPTTQLEK
jgi:hypothetical protein